MFTLKISTANDAFDNEGAELARILREVAHCFDNNSPGRGNNVRTSIIRDSNGNTVGKWELK
jgi:hypothetical protein